MRHEDEISLWIYPGTVHKIGLLVKGLLYIESFFTIFRCGYWFRFCFGYERNGILLLGRRSP